MKQIIDFIIIDKQSFLRAALLKLKSAMPLPEILGGQFVNVRVDGCDKAYLRRPISIHDVDYKNNIIDLLIQEKHEGTKTLCALPVGATVNIVLPLGNGFTMPEKDDNILLIGDTLFQDNVGRFDFPGGNKDKLFESIHNLYAKNLDDGTYVVHGHGMDTTIGWLKQHNPFFK